MINWIKKFSFGKELSRKTIALGNDVSADLVDENVSYKVRGNKLLDQGKLEAAADCYRHAVQADSQDIESCINLGYVLSEQKRYEEARGSLMRALEIAPSADAFYMLGTIAEAQSETDIAIGNFLKALEFKPDFEIIYRQLCQLYFGNGDIEKAREIIQRGIALNPMRADFHFYLGNVHVHEKEFEQATGSFLQAISIQPNFAEVYGNMGLAYQAQGKSQEAVESFKRALEINPGDAMTHHNLGISFNSQGMPELAIDSFQRAIDIKPDFAEAHNRHGLALHSLGRLDGAVESLIEALRIKPDYVDAHVNLGVVRSSRREYTAAIECLQKALELKPDCADAYRNLGVAFNDEGLLVDAANSFRKALAIKPDDIGAQSNLLFVMSFGIDCPSNAYLTEARAYGEQIAALVKRDTPFRFDPINRMPRALRIGFVSGDLNTHPVGYFLENILEHLNPRKVELFAYPTSRQEDSLTTRIKPRFMAWNSIEGMDDSTAAKRIHKDQIDILVDLAGHTAHNRLAVFAWKPAPIQISWLGYFASTGVSEMDYLLADRVSVPESNQADFTEPIWYLPDTRLCFTPPAIGENLMPSPLPSLRNGYLTFGCFQNIVKLNDKVLTSWGEIMAAIPQARLRFQNKQLGSPAVRERLLSQLADVGVSPDRVSLVGPVAREAYLTAYSEVDFILDTFPYSGGTTTCEALWMGVPTLSICGETMLARQGASMLACCGLQEWIAKDAKDYVVRAVAHSAALSDLALLRTTLRKQVLASPLFDAPRFAHHLEDAFHAIWKNKILQ